MDFNEYQREALKTRIYPSETEMPLGLIYAALKLNGESGEIAEKIGKIIRDKNGVMTEVDRALLLKELGDVLWYLSDLAYSLGSGLDVVAEMNIEKLQARQTRGKLSGSGDNR